MSVFAHKRQRRFLLYRLVNGPGTPPRKDEINPEVLDNNAGEAGRLQMCYEPEAINQDVGR